VVPDVPGYPADLLEILAPVNLRKTLGLKDEMEIEVTVRIE
jgi:CTP-dependent riboflavin kinase